jgi:hypothetical protein
MYNILWVVEVARGFPVPPLFYDIPQGIIARNEVGG